MNPSTPHHPAAPAPVHRDAFISTAVSPNRVGRALLVVLFAPLCAITLVAIPVLIFAGARGGSIPVASLGPVVGWLEWQVIKRFAPAWDLRFCRALLASIAIGSFVFYFYWAVALAIIVPVWFMRRCRKAR